MKKNELKSLSMKLHAVVATTMPTMRDLRSGFVVVIIWVYQPIYMLWYFECVIATTSIIELKEGKREWFVSIVNTR